MGIFRKKYKQIENLQPIQPQIQQPQIIQPQQYQQPTNVMTTPKIEEDEEIIEKLKDYLLKLSDSLLQTVKWLDNR